MKKNCSPFLACFSHAIPHYQKKNTKKPQSTLAFSLVEMLMALLVASLLLAALAPVMTRRLNENITISGTGSTILPTGGCVVTEGFQEDFCEVPQNTFSINAIIASGGGGGGGAAMGSYGNVESSIAISGETGGSTQTTRSYTITKDMRNITVQLVGGGGGAGSGWSNEGGYPASQTDCGNWGVFIGTEYSPTYTDVNMKHPICVSKRNPEINGANNAPKLNVSGVDYVNTGANCSGTNCCWVGTTSSSSDCGTLKNGMTYTGCTRSVCQYEAASKICAAWKPTTDSAGRLPTLYEMEQWKPGITQTDETPGILNKPGGYNAGAGLEFCSREASASVRCFYNTSNCPGSASPCNPDSTWNSTNASERGADYYYCGFMGGKSFAANPTFIKTASLGVRCVVDKISAFSTYTGGGGSSGLYIKAKIPDEVIRKATQNGGNARLELSAGSGGKGAPIRTSSSDTTTPGYGTNGLSSRAELYDENGQPIWAIQVPGGKTGYTAKNNSNGDVGVAVNRDQNDTNNACRYYNSYSKDLNAKTEKPVACAKIPDDGVVVEIQAGSAGSGGSGGRGYFDGTQPAAAGASNSVAGSDGTRGGGGGGGQCTIGSTRLTPICAAGGNGGGGMAKYSYQKYLPGVGGGGGGAGAVVHIKNISNGIRPGVKITMNAGQGGASGTAGSIGGNGGEGSAGGASYISYSTNGTNSLKFEVKGGEGGGGGIAGKPNENIPPTSGTQGGKSSIDTAKLNNLVGKTNYKFYPSNLDKTEGKKAEYKGNFTQAAGGNGGINSKISPTASKPCGGLSVEPIDYYGAKDINEDNLVCDLATTNTITPLKLTKEDIPGVFNQNMAAILSDDHEENYAGDVLPGATGGGGGSWSWPQDGEEKATAGEKGLGGYVIIYWNLQKEE